MDTTFQTLETQLAPIDAKVRDRSRYIITYWPKDSLPWYVSLRTYDEAGFPIAGQTLAKCRDAKVASGIVDRYVSA